jgi:hypothetical protein
MSSPDYIKFPCPQSHDHIWLGLTLISFVFTSIQRITQLVEKLLNSSYYLLTLIFIIHTFLRGRRGRDRMVVGLTDGVSSNRDQGEVYNIMW